jgi:aspartate aminotransferase
MTSPTEVAPTRRLQRWAATVTPFLSFYQGPIAPMLNDPSVANFAVGNPQELALPAYVDALRRHLEPRDKDWYAYKLSEPNATATVAGSLSARTGLAWDDADVAMTNGGFAALAVAMRALLEPGEEVVFLSPPWFFYELLIVAAEGVPVRVRLDPPAFDIDPAAVEAAITPRTRIVLVNSPHNPSGRVFPLETWHALADVLARATERYRAPVYLLSDEPYNRILFDGRRFHSPAEAYARTVITYSYGKTLLAPGQRIGYLTWPPSMPDREALRQAVIMSQLATGFAFPNALLQHAIGELEGLSIDIGALERRRDRLVPALAELGYEPTRPEGTFYVMARAPIDDDGAFAEVLARHRVLVLPGSIVEVPGWFRISLTASDAMVEQGIAGFAAAMREVRG